jgi:hypothetical protein
LCVPKSPSGTGQHRSRPPLWAIRTRGAHRDETHRQQMSRADRPLSFGHDEKMAAVTLRTSFYELLLSIGTHRRTTGTGSVASPKKRKSNSGPFLCLRWLDHGELWKGKGLRGLLTADRRVSREPKLYSARSRRPSALYDRAALGESIQEQFGLGLEQRPSASARIRTVSDQKKIIRLPKSGGGVH